MGVSMSSGWGLQLIESGVDSLALEVIDELGEEISPLRAVSIVAWVDGGRRVERVGAPDVVGQQDVLGASIQSSHVPVVSQGRGEASIVAGGVAVRDIRGIAREGNLCAAEAIP